MANWKSININTNQIKANMGKAILLAMPHNSDYDGYVFWHTLKLIRDGKHLASISLNYTDDFTFCIKKYGKGKYNNRKVIDEKIIGVEEFENAFDDINKNITKKEFKNSYETHKPKVIKAIKNSAIKELQDNEQ